MPTSAAFLYCAMILVSLICVRGFGQSADFKDVAVMEDAEARMSLSPMEEPPLLCAELRNQPQQHSWIEAQFSHAPPAAVALPKGTPTIPAHRTTTSPGPELDSAIVSDSPESFAEFRGKKLSLLWLRGRDRFGAHDFHGRMNTLILIEDIKANTFCGFGPVPWKSPQTWQWNIDGCLKSFIFEPNNAHNILERRFA
jgi:hypothetical protein